MPYPLVLPQNQAREAQARGDEFLPLVPIEQRAANDMRKQSWVKVEVFISEECDPGVIDKARGVGAIVYVVQSPVYEHLQTWKQAVLDRLVIKQAMDSTQGSCLKFILRPILESYGYTNPQYSRMIQNAEASGLVAHNFKLGLLRWTNKYDGRDRRRKPSARKIRIYKPRPRFEVTPSISMDDGRING